MSLTVVNWNLQWATPSSKRSPEILCRIGEHRPEIACLTETDADFMQSEGFAICSLADYGLGLKRNRRKVVLWSKKPWRSASGLGRAVLPPGRFVAGETDTSIGPVTAVGICIPWSGSRTARFGGRQRQWQDHEEYLDGLKALLAPVRGPRVVVMGDFNQRIAAKSNVPVGLRNKLREAFPPAITVATADLEFGGRKTIDHLAITGDLSADRLCTIDNITDDGKLSDHFGVVANLSRTADHREPSFVE